MIRKHSNSVSGVGGFGVAAVFTALCAMCATCLAATTPAPPAQASDQAQAPAVLPRPDHVVIVIEENKDYGQVIGSEHAPYITHLAKIGANLTNMHGVMHPSQPNYIAFFSGSLQTLKGVPYRERNKVPPGIPFNTPNLGDSLRDAGLTFIGYCEGLFKAGHTGGKGPGYARRHNPWVNWQNDDNPGEHQLPASVNQPFSAFPSDFSKLPTVAIVVPSIPNDMHKHRGAKTVREQVRDGDAWLKEHMSDYIEWARDHNSLFILTFDESDNGPPDKATIPTVFVGPMVKPGNYDKRVTLYDLLRTVEDMYGLPHAGHSAQARPITQVFVEAAPG